MKAKLTLIAVAIMLMAQNSAACEPIQTEARATTPGTVTEGVMATFELTRSALQRQAYLDCMKPELPAAQPEIKLKKIDTEFKAEEKAYTRNENTVASK